MRHQLVHDVGACVDAITWAETFDTPQEAWDACERGDRMLWLLGKLAGPVGSDSRRKLVLATTQCARLAWPHVREQDRGVIQACHDACEAYGRSDPTVTLGMVRAADGAAYAAYAAGYNAAYVAYAAARNAADAAYAAARNAADAAGHIAAYAADAAGHIAAYAAEAADAYAAGAAAYAAARSRVFRECADIVRRHYPTAPTAKGAAK